MNNFEQAIEKLNKLDTRYKNWLKSYPMPTLSIIKNNTRNYQKSSLIWNPIMLNFKKYNESV